MKILYVITEDWFFHSHFLDRAKYIAASGGTVGVATRFSVHQDELKDLGFELYPINFSRRGLNPITEFVTALKLRNVVRRFKPDIAHNVALKPVVTGTFGELLGRQGVVINALVGMGYIFTSTDTRASVVKPILSRILKSLLRSKPVHVVIENPDDLKALVDDGFVRPGTISLIRGAGVDLNAFPFHPEVAGPVVVTLVSRILRDKGVLEFIEAVKKQGAIPRRTLREQIYCMSPEELKKKALAAQASFPRVDQEELAKEFAGMRDEWDRTS